MLFELSLISLDAQPRTTAEQDNLSLVKECFKRFLFGDTSESIINSTQPATITERCPFNLFPRGVQDIPAKLQSC